MPTCDIHWVVVPQLDTAMWLEREPSYRVEAVPSGSGEQKGIEPGTRVTVKVSRGCYAVSLP